jgi:hypothetical protein
MKAETSKTNPTTIAEVLFLIIRKPFSKEQIHLAGE